MTVVTRLIIAYVLAALVVAAVTGCTRDAEPAPAAKAEEPKAPSNRIDLPGTVRRNLGVTFATVESRPVAATLRVPGRFELLPTARREYRAPLDGRVELLVSQYQRVERGTPLYRIDAPEWRSLHESIIATHAKVASMGPLREAHRVHEESLAEKVKIWKARIVQLESLREAGGGSAAQLTEAMATLNATQAELADVMEKDAELAATEEIASAELRALESRRAMILAAAGYDPGEITPTNGSIEVRAVAPGVVEALDVTTGGLATTSSRVLSTLQPEAIRFRARGLQSDLGRLRDGLAARIAPPQGGAIPLQSTMKGPLQLALTADPDERTVDLLVQPSSLETWARAGVAAHLEITLEGGTPELAIPLAAVLRDGTTPIIFRRDPKNPDQVIRLNADLGVSDGRWIVVASGVKEGDEIVVGGNYQLLLATSGSAPKGGHFHSDGTFHEGEH
ncbi:MAG: hypothetical protein JNM94_00115 [Phycisphaerae bacterium]|nr:hypothetical protein [Phycisphaerae bacterium]